MDMDNKQNLQDGLKIELENLSGEKFSNSEVWESYYNLSGFFRVLKQMKKEADYGITI